jgi:hypothetical protein
MIGLKKLTLVNETIRHLGYKTSRYIKLNLYVHLNEFMIQHTHYF